MTVRPSFAARTKSRPPGSDQGEGRHADRPLHVGDRHAAVGAVDDQREPVGSPSSTATSRSWTAARRAGTSGVTGTRIRSASSKIAWLSALYDGCRSTTTKSKPRRAA